MPDGLQIHFCRTLQKESPHALAMGRIFEILNILRNKKADDINL